MNARPDPGSTPWGRPARAPARCVVALAAALAAMAPAYAGQTCRETPLKVDEVKQSMALAERTMAALEASGAEVALVARAGQDLSKYGISYSHMGIVVRDHPAGRWTVVHELNDCGTANSDLYTDGLGNFFLTDLFRYQGQVVLPGPALQARLKTVLASRTARRLHEPHYSMVAYVYSTRYQNSNGWVLEVLAAAGAAPDAVATRAEAQQELRRRDFRPPTIHVPAVERLGGRMFRANVAFDDHPFDRRMAGRIDTVSTDAILGWLRANDAGVRVLRVD